VPRSMKTTRCPPGEVLYMKTGPARYRRTGFGGYLMLLVFGVYSICVNRSTAGLSVTDLTQPRSIIAR
jgi:hypothetical protein